MARQTCSSGSSASLPLVRNHTCERGSRASPTVANGGVSTYRRSTAARASISRSTTPGELKRSAYRGSISAAVGSVSGSGAAGMGAWCSMPSSWLWKDAERWKIGCPCWTATTRRVVKDRPSRMRSTVYTMGAPGSPARRKYACREWAARSAGTVRPAATSAWAATWPPNTRGTSELRLMPRKMSRSICSRSSRWSRSSRGSGLSVMEKGRPSTDPWTWR